MADYLLIVSRDPFETNGVAHFYDLARTLAAGKNKVSLFLVQNGVLPARRSTRSEPLTALSRAGVEVLADSFSLKERGIAAGRLAEGVTAAPLERVIDQLADGRKAIWY